MKNISLYLIMVALVALQGLSSAAPVNIYVDAAPNAYGSPDYAPWEAVAFTDAFAGTFVNMSNGVNTASSGTTNFEIQDKVLYSFGDPGKRLTWIYWVDGVSISDLETANFQTCLINTWDGSVLDFYDSYCGSTWLTPTKWVEYNGGVIGTAGMAY